MWISSSTRKAAVSLSNYSPHAKAGDSKSHFAGSLRNSKRLNSTSQKRNNRSVRHFLERGFVSSFGDGICPGKITAKWVIVLLDSEY